MATDEEPHWGAVRVDPREKSIPGLKARFLVEESRNAKRLLDIGSGGGKLLHTLHAEYPDIELHGCDIRPVPPSPIYEFRQVTSARLPYDDGQFDTALLFDVLEHVDDPAGLLSQAARVLEPGGHLVGFVPLEGEKLSLYRVYRAILGDDLYVATKDHIQSYAYADVVRLLKAQYTIGRVDFAYHVLGHVMDASFFALARLKRVQRFWWKENSLYHGEQASTGALSRVLNSAMTFANRCAFVESSTLSKSSFAAAGILFRAQRNSVRRTS